MNICICNAGLSLMVYSHGGAEGGGLEMSDKLIKLLSCGRNPICTTVDHELHSSTPSPSPRSCLALRKTMRGRGLVGGPPSSRLAIIG